MQRCVSILSKGRRCGLGSSVMGDPSWNTAAAWAWPLEGPHGARSTMSNGPWLEEDTSLAPVVQGQGQGAGSGVL
ncbi:unnamed protein product [Lota lota]